MKLLFLYLTIYIIFLSPAWSTEIVFSGLIGDEGAVLEVNTTPTPEGNPGNEGVSVEAIEEAAVWQTLASFKISSPYNYGRNGIKYSQCASCWNS